MRLHELTQVKPKNHGTKRKGRGMGSGKGKTAGRGTKGQKARTGGNVPAHFEGGQKPLAQIIPKKKGFRRPNRPQVLVINLSDLPRLASGNSLTLQTLRDKGYLNGFDSVKILGDGEIKEAFTVEAHNISAAARQKIEQAGGKVNLV
ncbi:MAG: 50S ribosomal protein L15 [Patescibacteria group bacterium]|jgi:large subunit ribosomal protein L15